MKLRFWYCFLMLLWQAASAADATDWTFEFKGGVFHSADKQWPDFYGNDRFPAYALSLGYMLFRQLEVGMEAGYLADEGKGFAPLHGTLAGKLKYHLYPLHLNMTLRGAFSPDQWLVPYIGVGISRYSYRVETEQQSDITGSLNGYQYRAGLQLLMDNLEKSSAYNLDRSFGIVNTYFFLEAQQLEVNSDNSDLGGTAYLGGIRFEY